MKDCERFRFLEKFFAPCPSNWVGFEKCSHGVEFMYACESCDSEEEGPLFPIEDGRFFYYPEPNNPDVEGIELEIGMQTQDENGILTFFHRKNIA